MFDEIFILASKKGITVIYWSVATPALPPTNSVLATTTEAQYHEK